MRKKGDQRGKRRPAEKIVAWIVFASLALSMVFVIFKLITAPSGAVDGHIGGKMKSDYVLMLVQCILGLMAWMLPSFLTRHKWMRFPDSFLIMYFIFLYCAIYLGEIRNFYYAIPHWDTILHAFSGAMLGVLGFTVLTLLHSNITSLTLSPAFVALFAFCFAVALGAIWEIYEFTIDSTMALNMQKYLFEDGTEKIGRAALTDTMKDLIVDVAGAAVMSVTGFIMMKKKPGWLNTLHVKEEEKKEEQSKEDTADVFSIKS